MIPPYDDDGVSDDNPDDQPCAAGDFEVLMECPRCSGDGWIAGEDGREECVFCCGSGWY